jgi:hypothetical protein
MHRLRPAAPPGPAVLGVLAIPAVLAVLAAPLSAQSGESPSLIFTISGGLTGARALWEVPAQPFPVPPSNEDTFALARRLRPGLVATLGAVYYRNPNLGYVMEIGYFGVQSESRCTPLNQFSPGADSTARSACGRIHGTHIASSVVGFQAGLVYRAWPARGFSPYARASAGFGILGTSFVQTEALVISSACTTTPACTFALLAEQSRQELALVGTLAAGFAVTLTPGYKVRLEVRDFVAGLPHVDGAATVQSGALPVPPISTRLTHNFVATMGIDIVLERRRGRRY